MITAGRSRLLPVRRQKGRFPGLCRELGCHAPPVRQTTEHDLDVIAPLVAVLVMFKCRRAGLPAGDARLCFLVLPWFSQLGSVISSICQEPVACGKLPNSPPMVANLFRRHDEPDRPTLRIGEGVTRGKRWSGIFDRFAAPLSFGMGFMSGGGFQVLVGGIMGLSWRQQPMR